MSAIRALVVLAGLAGCAAPVAERTYIRAVTRPVYSIAALDPARIKGDWVQVAGFENACQGGALRADLHLTYDLCLSQGRRQGQAIATSVPGRFDSPDGALWVLWADADNRTLVIGGPDGGIGAVLNRDGAISADRMQAARDILGFNGYDLTRFVAY